MTVAENIARDIVTTIAEARSSDWSDEQIRHYVRKLTDAAEAGTLTEADLDRAASINVYDPGDGPPESIGADWIHSLIVYEREPGFFGRTIVHDEGLVLFSRAVPDVGAFLRRHITDWLFTMSMLMKASVLRLIKDPAERSTYVLDAFARNGAWNDGWVRAATDAGVSTEVISEAILLHLDASPADRDLEHSSTQTYVRECMEYGTTRDGQIERLSTWGVLTPDWFSLAMDICFEKSPATALRYRAELAVAFKAKGLTDEDLADRCEKAAQSLGDLTFLGFAAMRLLSLNTRIKLAAFAQEPKYGTDHRPALLVNIASELEREDPGIGAAWLDQMIALHKPDAVAFLHTAKNQLGDTLPDWILRRAEHLLAEQRCVLGTVREESYLNRKTQRRMMQDVVDVPGGKVVHDSYYSSNDRYYPHAGDRVIIQMANITQIAVYAGQSVWRGKFIPVDPRKRD